jgi:predicted esterase
MIAPHKDPHTATRTESYGAPVTTAKAAVILLHGRGASPEDILYLGHQIALEEVAYLAPEAAGWAWYPQTFLAPLEANQPYLDSALKRVGTLLENIESEGLSSRRIALGGFSQGACLALEYVRRNPKPYGALFGFSGGLIGPTVGEPAEGGSLEGTPVFLGCSDVDPYIPAERVHESAALMEAMGAQVETVLYPGMGHTIVNDEIERMRAMLEEILA